MNYGNIGGWDFQYGQQNQQQIQQQYDNVVGYNFLYNTFLNV